jgi:mannose-6-phosphate isomerase-like protein (cupin superfamily)
MDNIRPWGNYEVVKTDEGYQVKVLNIYAGKRISLQTHKHRSETWYVVSGKGTAQVRGANLPLFAGVVVQVPKKAEHRITAKTNLKIVEIQVGAYLGEDDIIRLDDDYGRVV